MERNVICVHFVAVFLSVVFTSAHSLERTFSVMEIPLCSPKSCFLATGFVNAVVLFLWGPFKIMSQIQFLENWFK